MVPHRRPEEIGVHPVHAAQGEQPREREDTEPAAGLPEPDQVPQVFNMQARTYVYAVHGTGHWCSMMVAPASPYSSQMRRVYVPGSSPFMGTSTRLPAVSGKPSGQSRTIR